VELTKTRNYAVMGCLKSSNLGKWHADRLELGLYLKFRCFLDPLWFVILALATLNFGFAYMEWGTVLA